MDSYLQDNGPSGRHASLTRQITLGEGLAALRAVSYEGVSPARLVDVDAAIKEVMALPVCAVCGFTRRGHTGACKPMTCGEFTR